MIGGVYSLSSNIVALNAIMTEWARTDISYAARIDHILGVTTGGLNGTYFFNNTTLSNDNNLIDVVTGGNDQDWFIKNIFDNITDQDPLTETLTLI